MEESHFSILDKQVRKAFSLQHSMFESDQLLFHMPLADRLQTSHESKALWLQSVSIAIHDFTIVCLLYTSDAADELDGVDL
eukprot:12539328-Ditylum_brightwellii.AAC.1